MRRSVVTSQAGGGVPLLTTDWLLPPISPLCVVGLSLSLRAKFDECEARISRLQGQGRDPGAT